MNCSYDAVNSSSVPVSWRDEAVPLSGRSQFLAARSWLQVSPTRTGDAGTFRCRVDYVHGQVKLSREKKTQFWFYVAKVLFSWL